MPSPTYPPHKHNDCPGIKLKKKKKKPETESWRKKKGRKHFLNEGEKERKEGGDKEKRKNV